MTKLQKYEITEDITISNQDNSGKSVVVSFTKGEVVTVDAYTLPQISNLVAKGLAKRYVAPRKPATTKETE